MKAIKPTHLNTTPNLIDCLNNPPLFAPYTTFCINNIMKQDDETPRGKTGPKPKSLKPVEILGLEIGRGETKNIVPPEHVYDLTALGLSSREIAQFYGVTDDSIRRNFAAEIAKGSVYQKIKLRRAMMNNATEHMNAAVQIFLAKAMLGMSETGSSENTVLPWVETEEDSNEDSQQDNTVGQVSDEDMV